MAQLLDKVVESLKREKSDMLVLLNYIELLRILVSKPYTMDYIRSSTAVEILKDLLSHPDDPNATFYMPGRFKKAAHDQSINFLNLTAPRQI